MDVTLGVSLEPAVARGVERPERLVRQQPEAMVVEDHLRLNRRLVADRHHALRLAGIPAADASGRVTFDVQIPGNLAAGSHTIVVFGADGNVIRTIPITVVAAGQLAATGAQAPLGAALLASFLLVAGGVVWTLRRPRRTVS